MSTPFWTMYATVDGLTERQSGSRTVDLKWEVEHPHWYGLPYSVSLNEGQETPPLGSRVAMQLLRVE